MAKANAVTGTSYYVAEGAPLPGPTEVAPDVRLVGPGAVADNAPEANRVAQADQVVDTDTDREDEVVEVSTDPADTGDVDSADYEALTVEELREALAARDLPRTGNKAELVDRLRDDDEHPADA